MYGQHLPPGRGPGGTSGGGEAPFSDAFDFSFGNYATPGLVKVVYVMTFVLCIVEYVGIVLWSWLAGFLTPIFVIPAVLFGWVFPFLTLLGTRLALEHYLATVRTAQEVRALRERAELWLRGARA